MTDQQPDRQPDPRERDELYALTATSLECCTQVQRRRLAEAAKVIFAETGDRKRAPATPAEILQELEYIRIALTVNARERSALHLRRENAVAQAFEYDHVALPRTDVAARLGVAYQRVFQIWHSALYRRSKIVI